MLNIEQGFVKTANRYQLVEILKELLSMACFEYKTNVLPKHNKRKKATAKKWRHFLVSESVDGWVGVFEDHRYMDKKLVKELSAKMQTSGIWISYSETVEELAYVVYEKGNVVQEIDKNFSSKTIRSTIVSGIRPRSPEELRLYDTAMEFYNRHSLPLKFYSYEEIDEMMNKEEYFIHLNFRSSLGTD